MPVCRINDGTTVFCGWRKRGSGSHAGDLPRALMDASLCGLRYDKLV